MLFAWKIGSVEGARYPPVNCSQVDAVAFWCEHAAGQFSQPKNDWRAANCL
jgi:hypothetical protein